MIISNSSITLSAEHRKVEQDTVRQRLRYRSAPPNISRGKTGTSDNNGLRLGHYDKIGLSTKSQATAKKRGVVEDVPPEDRPMASLNILILRKMIERLTGKVIDVRYPQDVRQARVEEDVQGVAEQRQEENGFSLEYTYSASHYEYEATSFSGSGIIHTADGREIAFSVELNMSREFMSSQEVSLRAGEALKDPLTVHFDGTQAELDSTTFAFDIDMDGIDDQFSLPKTGSGYLALDKDEDGIITNGGELFGAVSGDGFGELAGYDQDKNGWIDENDDIFDKLRIWSRSADGQTRLFALGEVGIGAIYLHHVSTPFSIKDENNELQAQVRESSIFVKEDGSVGTIQQIDLVV